jgi:hypothetical protein
VKRRHHDAGEALDSISAWAAFSGLSVMFFSDPVVAFANIWELSYNERLERPATSFLYDLQEVWRAEGRGILKQLAKKEPGTVFPKRRAVLSSAACKHASPGRMLKFFWRPHKPRPCREWPTAH